MANSPIFMTCLLMWRFSIPRLEIGGEYFRYFAWFFEPRRHFCQSASVALYMTLAALWSQRPRRDAKSRLIFEMAFGLPKCMFAVYQPMLLSSRNLALSLGSVGSSLRELTCAI